MQFVNHKMMWQYLLQACVRLMPATMLYSGRSADETHLIVSTVFAFEMIIMVPLMWSLSLYVVVMVVIVANEWRYARIRLWNSLLELGQLYHRALCCLQWCNHQPLVIVIQGYCMTDSCQASQFEWSVMKDVQFLGHRLGDDLVDWKWGVSVRTSVRPSVRPYVRTSVRTSVRPQKVFPISI